MQVEECPHSPCRGHPICPECRGDVTLSDSPMSQIGEEASGTDSEEEDKGSSGSSQSQVPMRPAHLLQPGLFQRVSSGQKGRERRERTQATSTINSSWGSPPKSLLPRLLLASADGSMRSSAEARMLKRIVPKKTQGQASLLSMELNRFEETQWLIGNLSGTKPKPEILMEFQLMYVWYLIVPFERSAQTMQSLVKLNEQFTVSGAIQQLENQDVLGTQQDWMLTLSVRGPSSGLVTKVRKTLLSMNFVEVLMSPMCYDGQTGMRSMWKSRELQDPLMLKEFSLPPISIPRVGIPVSTLQPKLRLNEE